MRFAYRSYWLTLSSSPAHHTNTHLYEWALVSSGLVALVGVDHGLCTSLLVWDYRWEGRPLALYLAGNWHHSPVIIGLGYSCKQTPWSNLCPYIILLGAPVSILGNCLYSIRSIVLKNGIEKSPEGDYSGNGGQLFSSAIERESLMSYLMMTKDFRQNQVNLLTGRATEVGETLSPEL